LLLWPLLAFGGVAATTAIPFGVLCVAHVIFVAPRIEGTLDRSLLLVAAAVFLQLVPLPSGGALISPHAADVRKALALAAPTGHGWHPLTVDVPGTAWAAIELAGAVALFLAARERFNVHGVRRTTRAIAAIGFGISMLALIQAATAGYSIYWRYPTAAEGPLPFGPFANRNHFATWAIMALPLGAGYLVARADAHHRPLGRLDPRARVLDLRDDRTLWLTVSMTAMVVALLLSLSWPASFGMGIASFFALIVARRSFHPRRLLALLAPHLLLVGLALGWASVPNIRDHIAGPDVGGAHRIATWRETAPVLRNFVATGTGAGTYELVMRVYQRTERRVYFNQAQNHYLQLAAEGGLLVGVPFLLAAAAFARTAWNRLGGDRSGVWWIRLGAACGLAAVAIQSFWETGLTMTANAALAAVLAALVVHRRESL
jgi:hypothetical protein